VLAGFAVTEAPEAELSPVVGDHVYVSAPVAVNVVEPPAQIVALGEAETPTVGGVQMTTAPVSVSETVVSRVKVTVTS